MECENTNGCVGFTFVDSRCDLKSADDAVYLSNNYGCNVISFKREFITAPPAVWQALLAGDLK